MRSKLTWACVWVGGFAVMAGRASALATVDNPLGDVNPYSVISDRNVFHLNPPPPPPAPPEAKPADLPKVMLTGFVGKGSRMKVYLAIPPANAKESIYYTSGLVPGDKDHGVELVKINYDKKEVDIINEGTAQTLSVKSNSYTSVAAAAPGGKGNGAPPGMPAGIGLRHQPPGFPSPNIPPRAAPTAAASPNGGGGSAIVAGGGGGGSTIVAGGSGYGGGGGGNASPFAANGASPYGGSSYGASTAGAIVSGGNSAYAPPGAPPAANNVGSQIATSLFNPSTGHYQMPPMAPPLPASVQAAGLLLHQQAGGPPAPPPVQQAAAEAAGEEGGGPPPPP
jgi:uncharacterized membrane protein YgcG